jgi:hypothetical protein
MGTSIKQELHDHPDMPVGNVDCPTCGPELKVLANECAMSHHVNSTIVCRISGKVMDSENEPMAFPNGYVYSSKVCCNHKASVCYQPELMQDGIANERVSWELWASMLGIGGDGGVEQDC